jgi:hypothetical protein
MAAADHYLRFRRMTAEELVTESARLTALNNGFSQMGMGTKQFAMATRDTLDQLNAIAFVQSERGYSVPEGPRDVKNTTVFTTDFSGV